ncbi:MAG: 50S ribosomal protein L17 [Candidatus Levybacteria bacterium RIFCSPHIGHO2_12_FULL_38_12]|nr:MAG: 50S ribosomal protein L17 [Candidatus Levybacteria bacterium RIFCSPHIGHO2_01_FULL_38_12]OGH21946.1 MAG: 50S ribosomal protein L17 [Candidatus Levybacteria bacterium RIFCSPHIGHO2_02_FULL_37_18]OGH23018.1 MAG: 50S ribosomal protein L17 [Candidatus Levybacteria bacterium RIFCSPHIGHO2_12_FULL_38_12]OGH33640.1 MAG: 50S ribosomal protein L17 [Candidatus Levybacteria bacterium RIFCSPLOWO2_01_FULL_37_20]OGH44545.1 MAG: 50S ribosomal protein L17 [Candidatus Levybacteria bacterium RIFCSPLOWO2_02_
MKKKVFGRKFKRDRNERKALFKSLLSSLVLEERIKTTEQKAKAIKGRAEKLVTQAIKKGKTSQSLMQEYLTPPAIEKLITQVAPVFTQRNGGYTRIVRLGKRFGDNASYVLLEWVEKPVGIANSKLQIANSSKKIKSLQQQKRRKNLKLKKS